MPSIKVLAEGRRRTKPFHFGVWLSLARALALGARGPEFKSLYPDLKKNKCRLTQQFIFGYDF